MNTDDLRLGEIVIDGALVTLIWIIQVLHYPSFKYFDRATFGEAMLFHQRRISYIVIPLMLTQLVLTIYSSFINFNLSTVLGLLCLLGIWLSTFMLQVPIHSKLTSYAHEPIEKLVKSNMIRTALWTLKFCITLLAGRKGLI